MRGRNGGVLVYFCEQGETFTRSYLSFKGVQTFWKLKADPYGVLFVNRRFPNMALSGEVFNQISTLS